MERKKHPSYMNRPTSSLQLMSKFSKFQDTRRDDKEALQYASTEPLPSKLNTTGTTNGDLAITLNSFNATMDSQPTYKAALDPNAKPPPKKVDPIRLGSQMSKVISAPEGYDPEVDRHAPCGKRVFDADRVSNKDNTLIGGGADRIDQWKATTQSLYDGDASDKDRASRRKAINIVEPDQMVNTVTGELMGEYGTWKADLERKKRQKEQDILDDAEDAKVPDDPVMARLKSKFKARGANGIVGLGRLFRIMDDDRSGCLCFAEFKKAMKECNMEMNDTELMVLFKRFDWENKGSISYNDFIRTVAGSLNRRRKRLVKMAYDVLDKDGSGLVDINDMALAYDVSRHPEYLSGAKTKEQVLLELLDNFDVGGVKDGIVTLEEFQNYYTNISASIDNDDYFELMIRNAWHISGGEGQAANSSNKRVLVTMPDGTQRVEVIKDDVGLKANDKEDLMGRLKRQGLNPSSVGTSYGSESNKVQSRPSTSGGFRPSTVRPSTAGGSRPRTSNGRPKAPVGEPNAGIKMLVQRIKDAMKKRGAHGFIGVQRLFRIMDDDGNKKLCLSEFKKGIREMNIDIGEPDVRKLFEHFDADGTGGINFEEFLQGIRDPLNERRQQLVRKAFAILDRSETGEIDIDDIAGIYDASQHPEVIAKRKKPADVLKEFLDTFEVGGVKDGVVTMDEFMNYYANIGASIENDDYFELMIRNAWHIAGGEGAAANTANLRVKVTNSAGNERFVTIDDDLGLHRDDHAEIYNRLVAQGVKDVRAINGKTVKVAKGTNRNNDRVTAGETVDGLENFEMPAARGRPARFSSRPSTSGNYRSAPSAGRPTEAAIASEIHNGNLVQRVHHQIEAAAEQIKEEEKVQLKAQTLLEVLKVQLLSRGSAGIIDLQRRFIEMDIDGSKCLDMNEFRQAMIKNQLTFSEDQLKILFDYFDTDKSGTIDFHELLNGLRGQLPTKLLVLVHKVFDVLDTQGQNLIVPQDLLERYDPSRHPDAMQGTRSPDDIMKEFLDTFDVGSEQPGMITREEFVKYYTNLYASIDDEHYMELILRRVWKLGEVDLGRISSRPSSRHGTKRDAGVVNKLRSTVNEKRPNSASGYRRHSEQPSDIKMFNNNTQMYGNSGPVGAGTRYNTNQHDEQEEEPQLSEAELRDELLQLQNKAVICFNKEMFAEAEANFTEALQVMSMLFPANHPEVTKLERSLELVRRKAKSSEIMKNRQARRKH